MASSSLVFRLLGVDESASRALRGVGDAADKTALKLKAVGLASGKYAILGTAAVQTTATLAQVLGQAGPAAALAVPAVLSMAQGMGVLKLASDGVKKQFAQLTPELNRLKATAAGGIAPGIQSFITSLRSALPTVNAGVRQTAQVFGMLAAQAGNMVRQPLFRAELGTIMSANAKTMGNVGSAGLVVARAFVRIGAVAAPILTEVTSGLGNAARGVNAWVASMAASDELEQKIRNGINTIENLGKTVLNIFSGVHSLLKAVTRGSGDFSETLEKGSAAFKKWAESARVVNDVATFFRVLRHAAAEAFDFIRDGIRDISAGFHNPDLQPDSGVAGFFEHLGQVAHTLAGFFRTDLWPALKAVGDLFVNDLAPILRDVVEQRLKNLMASFAAVARVVKNDLVPIIRDQIVPIIRDDLMPVFDGLSAFFRGNFVPAVEHVVNVALEGLRGALSSIRSTIDQNRPQFEALLKIMRDVGGFVLTVLAPVVGTVLKFAFEQAGRQISLMLTLFGWYVRAIQGVANASLYVAQAVIESWRGIAYGILVSVSSILNVMSKLPGPLGSPWRHARDAVDGFRAQVDRDMNTAQSKVAAARDAMNAYLGSIHGKTVTVTIRERRELTYFTKTSPGSPGLTYYASGGQPRAGEWAMVGEAGPELVHFGRDAQVFNAGQTASMASSGRGVGGGINITVNVAGHILGERDFVTRVAPAMRDAIVRIAKTNGGTSGIR